jgi:hypothetical protein
MAAADRLVEIPGVSHKLAMAVIAETGLDMTRFPTADHLVSWARVALGAQIRMASADGSQRWGINTVLESDPPRGLVRTRRSRRPATPYTTTALLAVASARLPRARVDAGGARVA